MTFLSDVRNFYFVYTLQHNHVNTSFTNTLLFSVSSLPNPPLLHRNTSRTEDYYHYLCTYVVTTYYYWHALVVSDLL